MVKDLSRLAEPNHVQDVRELLKPTSARNMRRGRWKRSVSPAKQFQKELRRSAIFGRSLLSERSAESSLGRS